MRDAHVRLWRGALAGTVLAVVVALGVLLPKCEGPGPHPFTGPAAVMTAAARTGFPAILVVPRSQVIATMRHGYACTWDSPGWFLCTPAQRIQPEQAQLAALRTAKASTSLPCPAGTNCLPNPVLITNNAPGMGAPLLIEDNEGLPPGQNAVMFWVDGFQAGSVNPVCAAAVSPYLAREACLGGPPFDATGGHPVVSLWDGRRWQTLTAGDITWLHRAERLRPSW